MTDHAFNVEVAKDYGLTAAVIIQNFYFWTKTNLFNKSKIYDGLCWSYNTLDAFTKHFPYLSRRQVEHALNNIEKMGCIVKGNYNKKKYDRTLSYALTPKMYHYFPDINTLDHIKLLYSTIDHSLPINERLPISQFCEMDFTKFVNGFHKNVTPIPDTTTDTTTDTKKQSIAKNDKNLSSPVDNSPFPEKQEMENKKGSVCLKTYPDDFLPNDESNECLARHATRTNCSFRELLEKFATVSRTYKTRSTDWQRTFRQFLENERPKKTYEDEQGRKRRYDNKPINY